MQMIRNWILKRSKKKSFLKNYQAGVTTSGVGSPHEEGPQVSRKAALTQSSTDSQDSPGFMKHGEVRATLSKHKHKR